MPQNEFATRFADELVRLHGNDEDRAPVARDRALDMGGDMYDPAAPDADPEECAMDAFLCGDR